jgi:predicted cupin superfamily sugar epimerase
VIARAQQLIESLGLAPHPEGGWYRQVFKSDAKVTRQADGATRSALTTIYFLLTAGSVSRPHRVSSDEVWHFYEGGALELTIGDDVVLLDADHRVRVVPANVWQSARPLGEYALVGCTVGPGFEFEDFVMG